MYLWRCLFSAIVHRRCTSPLIRKRLHIAKITHLSLKSIFIYHICTVIFGGFYWWLSLSLWLFIYIKYRKDWPFKSLQTYTMLLVAEMYISDVKSMWRLHTLCTYWCLIYDYLLYFLNYYQAIIVLNEFLILNHNIYQLHTMYIECVGLWCDIGCTSTL